MKNTLPTTVLSILLASSLLVNGTHVRDALSASTQADNINQAVKIAAGDLHPHVDKQIHKLVHDIPQLDGRSLRLRDYKKVNLNGVKNLLNSWRDQLSLYLG